MRRTGFRPLLILVALLAFVGAACAGGSGELGGPAEGGTLAIKVGTFSYTNEQLEAEVDEWASNPLFLESGTGITDVGSPGARSMEITTFVVGWRVFSEQARQAATAEGYKPTAEELTFIRQSLEQSAVDPSTGGSLLRAFDADFQDQFIEDLTYQQHLGQSGATPADLPTAAVNSRYGSYDADLGLTPPQGPLVGAPAFAS